VRQPVGVADGLSGPVGAGAPGDDPLPTGHVRREARPPASGPSLVVALVVVVLVAGGAVAAWSVLRRPPAPEQSLPRADATASPTALEPAGGASPAGRTSSTTSSTMSSAASSGGGTAGVDAAGSADPVVVHVAGAVARPGVVSVRGGSRAIDAVTAAGGMALGADPDRVNLAAKVVDGERLVIPLIGQAPPAEVVPQGAPSAAGAGAGAAGPVELNSATAEQLDALPGVGPATASAIITHRDQHGPFRSVEDLLDVRGIGDAKLDSLRDLVTVTP
jgi:competence protein ComEA